MAHQTIPRWLYVYKGEWKDGKRQGIKELANMPMELPTKGTKWKNDNDKKHDARGIERYHDENVLYDGEFKDGRGRWIWNSILSQWRYVYNGTRRAGILHGKGVMIFANQDVYDGEWNKGLKDGEGTMKYHNGDGDLYKGEFSNDQMQGKGVFECAAGDVFKLIGEWKEGKKRGLFQDVVRSELANKSFMMPTKPD